MDTKISKLIANQKIVTLSGADTVESALNKLGESGISSAPVLDDGKAVGFLDVLDILAFLIQSSTKPFTATDVGESRSIHTDDLKMLQRRTKDFRITEIKKLIDLSKRNPWITTSQDTTISQAISLFANSKVHRVAVVDGSSLKGILTQSMILQYLDQVLRDDPAFKNLLASDIKMTPLDNMLLVAPKCPAIDAFMVMFQNSVSSAAIIDGNKLLGNLSASDLKSSFGRDFNNLKEPVLEWLKQAHKSMSNSPDYLVCCTQDTLLLDVIHRLTKERVHRIFVVDHIRDQAMSPLGVISLTDILQGVNNTREVS